MRLSLRRLSRALLFLLPAVVLLVACSGATTDSAGSAGTTEQQSPTAIPTAVVLPGDLPYTSGRNADGTYFIGEPDAPVTLIDYSDFL